jgi:hypothetical protein
MRFYAEVMEDVSKQAEIRKNCFLLFPPELNQVLTSADVSLSLKHGSNHSCKARGQDLSCLLFTGDDRGFIFYIFSKVWKITIFKKQL